MSVGRKEYDNLPDIIKRETETRTDAFIKRHPSYENRRDHFDKMYSANYATLNKADDGLCVLLDRSTMLCSVYDDRPKACREYTTDKCSKIRQLCT